MPKTKITQDLFIPATLGIIGYGIVGQALAYGFEQKSGGKDSIVFYDKFKDSLPLEEVVKQSEFIFICLPTPMKADESGIDLSIIDDSIKKVVKITDKTDKIVVIKSTVVPGTTASFETLYPNTHFAFNPEFLTEANYLHDFVNADRTVIGANNDLVKRRVASLYRARFPESTIYLTDPTSAETVKYFANNFLATKVAFANMMYDFCEAKGINYDEVKNMATADPRIGLSHLGVTTERGFGMKCFPKDMVALLGEARRIGADFSVLESIWDYNKRIRKVHDWKEIPFAVGKSKKSS
jgi:UDPglucose 6-dehydrogenase